SRRRHTRCLSDWSSDVCSSDLLVPPPPPVPPAVGSGEPEQPARGLAVSTAIFAAATALSRVLGLVREVVAAYYFGAAGKINAFKIGRASCRERGWIAVVGVSSK